MRTADLLAERMGRQGLSRRRSLTSAAVAGLAVGLQAQDIAAARLGVRARSDLGGEEDVRAAVDIERTVVRTWLMRATVHLVPNEDIVWMTALFGPMIERRFANVRWRGLGITPSVIDQAVPLAREVLAGGPLTRHALAAALADRGVRLADDPQAATHLTLALSARGVTCRGADVNGRDSAFALLEEWAPRGNDPADPLAELARRYFRAFGPATAADFTTWSGLPSTKAIAAIRDELSDVPIEGGRVGYRLGAAEPIAGLRLLPMFDNYLLGYRDRSSVLDPSRYREVFVGGLIKATVVDAGRVIATWRIDKRAATIVVTPFDTLTIRQLRDLDGECDDLSRWLDRPMGLRLTTE